MKPKLPDGPWEHVGIPGRSRIDTLLYSRTAESLVAVTARRLEEGLEVQRLYYRRIPWELYSPVSIRHPMESQSDAVCCWDAPFLFFNVWRYYELKPKSWYPSEILGGRHEPSPAYGGDWLGIDRFDLRTGERQTALDEQTILVPPPFAEGWVSGILSVSPDGTSAICNLGLRTGGQVKYFVCEVGLTGGPTKTIAELPGVWV